MVHGLLDIPKWLYIEGKQMRVQAIAIRTSPTLLNRVAEDGVRAANREELEMFARLYKPAKDILVVHAVDSESANSMFGPIAKLYATKGARVEHVRQNPVWGVPGGTIFLWVKEGTPPTKVI
jgi:hypothetical protein